jgi:hypothetical protein
VKLGFASNDGQVEALNVDLDDLLRASRHRCR